MVALPPGAAILELGCGKRKAFEQAVGVDINDFGPADVVANLERTPWKWAWEDSFRLVVAHQTLEHIRRLRPVMAEIWRVCAEGAYVEIVVPYAAGRPALQDPTHVRFFTEETFRYWEPGYIEPWGDYGIENHFAICAMDWLIDGNLWVLLHPLKTQQELGVWWVARALSLSGLVTWPAPAWLLERGPELLGKPIPEGQRRPGLPIG